MSATVEISKDFDASFLRVQTLASDFHDNQQHYLSPQYQEQEARQDFIDKFWKALGWDVSHDTQRNPYEQEVKVERAMKISEANRRADYSFSLAPDFQTVRFFVEAKKPSREIRNRDDYFQTIRYGWNGQTPLAVLTDFEQFHILDCRGRPDIETALDAAVKQYRYTDYTDKDKFAEIYWLFSREAVADKSIEKYVAEQMKRAPGRGGQRRLDLGGIIGIDESFLRDLDGYRGQLAQAFHATNPARDSEELTEATQRVLDRLVFMRFLEDKLIEPTPMVSSFVHKASAWNAFRAERSRLDRVYNGNIFKEHLIDKAGFHAPDNAVFSDICEQLASDHSPYLFNQIPIHILGSIYERFLGNVIVFDGAEAKVDQKPEVRKAGGVYYTPDYIVRYIVENTVGKQIAGKTPAEIAELRFADIACGSGSFLLGVYDALLRCHTDYYNAAKPRSRVAEARKVGCLEEDGAFRLSLWQKRDILLNNIWGVDIDAQAVEVAQLSLYLKLLEDETTASAHDQNLLHGAILPTLNKNIVFGNSLIGTDILQDTLFEPAEERKLNPLDYKQAFPKIMKKGGFDAIVGNPPYGFHQIHTQAAKNYFRETYETISGSFEQYFLFYEASLRLLSKGGMHGYIVPITWLTIPSASGLRRYVLSNFAIRHIAWLPALVFKNAQVNTLVSIIQRDKPGEIDVLISDINDPSKRLGTVRVLDQTSLPNDQAIQIFQDNIQAEILSKIDQRSQPLSFFARPCSGYNPYEVGKAKDENGNPHTKETVKQRPFHSSKSSSPMWKPDAIGRDLGRYSLRWPLDRFVKYGPWLSAARDPNNFIGPRLLVQEITGGAEHRIVATFCDKELYHSRDIIPVKCEQNVVSPLFLLGIVNSKLITWWHHLKSPKANKALFPKVLVNDLKNIPIATVTDRKLHDKMVSLVEQILLAKREQIKALMDKDIDYWDRRCAALDGQIDELVYELYGLTDKEIAIVIGSKLEA